MKQILILYKLATREDNCQKQVRKLHGGVFGYVTVQKSLFRSTSTPLAT